MLLTARGTMIFFADGESDGEEGEDKVILYPTVYVHQ